LFFLFFILFFAETSQIGIPDMSGATAAGGYNGQNVFNSSQASSSSISGAGVNYVTVSQVETALTANRSKFIAKSSEDTDDSEGTKTSVLISGDRYGKTAKRARELSVDFDGVTLFKDDPTQTLKFKKKQRGDLHSVLQVGAGGEIIFGSSFLTLLEHVSHDLADVRKVLETPIPDPAEHPHQQLMGIQSLYNLDAHVTQLQADVDSSVAAIYSLHATQTARITQLRTDTALAFAQSGFSEFPVENPALI